MSRALTMQFQKCKNLNNVPFLCNKLFQKRGHYSRGDIMQGNTVFKIFLIKVCTIIRRLCKDCKNPVDDFCLIRKMDPRDKQSI
jgi:hypothetical protein